MRKIAKDKKDKIKICPECGSVKLKQTSEGKICCSCGLVLEEGGYFSGRVLLV